MWGFIDSVVSGVGFLFKIIGLGSWFDKMIATRKAYNQGKQEQKNEDMGKSNKVKDEQLKESNNRNDGDVINKLRDGEF